jgi:hypothetical protein
MKHQLAIRASLISLIGASLVSCGASLGEYQKFSNAGKEYATALDSLLVTSGNYFVDTNSEILLRSDLKDPIKDANNYRKLTENDDRWLVLIGQMRQHTNLLKRYFITLENLATSDAPERAQKATENIFNELNGVSINIQGNPLISGQIGSALSQIPKIILSGKIKGALRTELQQRKEAIYRELSIQEVVLKFLTVQLKSNLQIIRDNQDDRLVLSPYTATESVSNPDEWIAKRRSIRTMTLSMEALTNASQSSKEFKESFQLLLEDKFTIGRANALLSDIDSLLNVAEELKQATNKPKES